MGISPEQVERLKEAFQRVRDVFVAAWKAIRELFKPIAKWFSKNGLLIAAWRIDKIKWYRLATTHRKRRIRKKWRNAIMREAYP